MAALTSVGLAPQPPVSVGEERRQGSGTYHVIKIGEYRVLISTLGRFAKGYDTGDGTGGAPAAARRALERAGFRWIDRTDGAILVTGLCVYYFGTREPLQVADLLFYWQD